MNARSLVGMSQSARKRQARRDRASHPDLVPANRASFFLHGARLRPCPGCPACRLCWVCGKAATCIGRYEDPSEKPRPACDDCCGHGCEDGFCDKIVEACTPGCGHRSFEYCGESGTHCDKHCVCPCRMCRDEHGPLLTCRGAGVLPARRSPAYGLQRPEDWDQHDFQWPWERFTSQICRRCDLSTYPGIKAIGTCYPMRKERR
jgi:hypothetical protein